MIKFLETESYEQNPFGLVRSFRFDQRYASKNQINQTQPFTTYNNLTPNSCCANAKSNFLAFFFFGSMNIFFTNKFEDSE